MSVLTAADVHPGQLWRDAGTPHVWFVLSVEREPIIGDIVETSVSMVDDFDPRNTLRIPASVLLAEYELEGAQR